MIVRGASEKSPYPLGMVGQGNEMQDILGTYFMNLRLIF